MDRNYVMTEPKDLVRIEMKNAGFDLDKIKIPRRVFLLADSTFVAILERNCVASAIYVITDTLNEKGWSLGWEGNEIGNSINKIIDMIINSVCFSRKKTANGA